MRQKLQYLTNAYVNVGKSPNGFPEVQGIEQYTNARCREKVIFRLDLLCGLRSMFTEETLLKYRPVIYNLLAGWISERERISAIVSQLYADDQKFKEWLFSAVYFEGVTCRIPLYQHICETASKLMGTAQEEITNKLDINAKPVAVAGGYLYCAVNDVDIEVRVPEGYAEEVVSYAKTWRGVFKAE